MSGIDDGSARTGSGEGAELALCTDLYEITMAASYLALGVGGTATRAPARAPVRSLPEPSPVAEVCWMEAPVPSRRLHRSKEPS
jgi:hypothetical protein